MMDSSLISDSFDSDVATFLIGLNLSKYIKNFSEQAIDLDIFLTLTDEDLSFIGIVDEEDRKTLIKGISHFKSCKKRDASYNENITFSDKDALVIASITMKQLSMLHAAMAHTRLRLKATPVCNNMIEAQSVASLLTTLAEEALAQNLILRTRLVGLEDLDGHDSNATRYAVKRRINWMVYFASATFAVASLLGYQYLRNSH